MRRKPLISVLKQIVADTAECEGVFGPATALMAHGKVFEKARRRPNWVSLGPKKECFRNAAAYALVRDDVFYVEGYAIDEELPIPIQHAWLMDEAGYAIDPTWSNSAQHRYFGIAFKQEFVRASLNSTARECGILVNHRLMRRFYDDPGTFKEGVLSRGDGA